VLLKIAERTLEGNMLSRRDSRADLKEGRRTRIHVFSVSSFENSVEITTLRAIHHILVSLRLRFRNTVKSR